MARPTVELIEALRATAARIAASESYTWSHFARCNCGHLAQTITTLSPREIYEAAFARGGDWGEQAREFCASSGYPIDYIIGKMLELGMTTEDVRHLERLSDDEVRRRVGRERELRHTRREDVVLYMEAWAELLESRLSPAERARLAAVASLPEAAE